MNNLKFRKSIHSKVHVNLRKLLVAQRKNISLSQRELAEKLQVTHSLIGKIETGDRRLDFVEMIEYCNALDLSLTVAIDMVKSQYVK